MASKTPTPPRRGRPPKFGRRGQVVAITLPEDAVRGLKRVDSDIGWAIVRLLHTRGRRALAHPLEPRADAELVNVANGKSLIVVNRQVFKHLPGVHLVPLQGDRAFLALEPSAGLADLELAVVDRIGSRSVDAHERRALEELRTLLRRWRRDPDLRCRTRSIIVVERVGAGR